MSRKGDKRIRRVCPEASDVTSLAMSLPSRLTRREASTLLGYNRAARLAKSLRDFAMVERARTLLISFTGSFDFAQDDIFDVTS